MASLPKAGCGMLGYRVFMGFRWERVEIIPPLSSFIWIALRNERGTIAFCSGPNGELSLINHL